MFTVSYILLHSSLGSKLMGIFLGILVVVVIYLINAMNISAVKKNFEQVAVASDEKTDSSLRLFHLLKQFSFDRTADVDRLTAILQQEPVLFYDSKICFVRKFPNNRILLGAEFIFKTLRMDITTGMRLKMQSEQHIAYFSLYIRESKKDVLILSRIPGVQTQEVYTRFADALQQVIEKNF